MALLDCAINIKCYTVDGGRCICPLFSSPPGGICQLKSPHPREFAIQGKKNANSRGSARGGALAQVELIDALFVPAKGMKPRNKTVEMEMQGTRDLPSVSFIKQTLLVCSWIDLFDDKNCISCSVESK